MWTNLVLLVLCILMAGLDPRTVEAFNCNVTVSSLRFGNYDFLSQVPLDSTANLNVDCNIPPQHPKAPMSVVVTLSPGNSGGFSQRWLQAAGPDKLLYNLYRNASCSTIWGDGGGNSSFLTGNVTSATPLNATIYGRIPPRQNVRVGSYSDSIVVTVNY